ncbi:probable glutamyl endopeptidase [Rhodopirellula baltica SH 1]|uniref:Probable glutamyl endopeptidase n=2 Tax=Rhodopirellula baltica TaxID=265606 RepID=Q7USW2_RHOBA|nr:probable glutamyl endopeptidase [Rhodopirellula baltica SH 1]
MSKNARKRKSLHKLNSKYWNQQRFGSCPERCNRCVRFPQRGAAASFLDEQPSFTSSEVPQDQYKEMPYSAVGKILFRSARAGQCNVMEDAYGSAWAIGPRTIMTVAHNLYETNCAQFSSNIVFVPGFGSDQPTALYSVVSYRFPSAYPEIPSSNNDVAICILDRDFDADVGFIEPLTHQVVGGDRLLALGYPSNHSLQNMWQCDGEFVTELSDPEDRIAMSSDFRGGSIGGPWALHVGETWRARGHQVGPYPGQAGDIQGSTYYGDQVVELLEWAGSILRTV